MGMKKLFVLLLLIYNPAWGIYYSQGLWYENDGRTIVASPSSYDVIKHNGNYEVHFYCEDTILAALKAVRRKLIFSSLEELLESKCYNLRKVRDLKSFSYKRRQLKGCESKVIGLLRSCLTALNYLEGFERATRSMCHACWKEDIDEVYEIQIVQRDISQITTMYKEGKIKPWEKNLVEEGERIIISMNSDLKFLERKESKMKALSEKLTLLKAKIRETELYEQEKAREREENEKIAREDAEALSLALIEDQNNLPMLSQRESAPYSFTKENLETMNACDATPSTNQQLTENGEVKTDSSTPEVILDEKNEDGLKLKIPASQAQDVDDDYEIVSPL